MEPAVCSEARGPMPWHPRELGVPPGTSGCLMSSPGALGGPLKGLSRFKKLSLPAVSMHKTLRGETTGRWLPLESAGWHQAPEETPHLPQPRKDCKSV